MHQILYLLFRYSARLYHQNLSYKSIAGIRWSGEDCILYQIQNIVVLVPVKALGDSKDVVHLSLLDTDF